MRGKFFYFKVENETKKPTQQDEINSSNCCYLRVVINAFFIRERHLMVHTSAKYHVSYIFFTKTWHKIYSSELPIKVFYTSPSLKMLCLQIFFTLPNPALSVVYMGKNIRYLTILSIHKRTLNVKWHKIKIEEQFYPEILSQSLSACDETVTNFEKAWRILEGGWGGEEDKNSNFNFNYDNLLLMYSKYACIISFYKYTYFFSC